MNKLYSRIVWENFPSEKTALNESNLNRMDLAIDNIDNRVIEMDSTKVNKEVANNLVKTWSIDEETGIITVEHLDGSKDLFDLNIEKIPVNFELSDNGILTMTTDDGTQYTANIGAMIPVLTFEDSDEIAVSATGTGVNKTYSFSIKSGSVTEDKLQPNFLADVKTEVAKAQASQSAAAQSASAASGSATLAESYTHGGTGAREGEDADNARYYMEQAKAVSAVNVATTETAGIVKPDGDTITVDPDGTIRGQSKVSEMTGATAEANGTSGTVPAPKAGQQAHILGGDGTWKSPLENEIIDAKIKELNKSIEDAISLRASLEAYGMVKVTDSSAVTDSTGLALAATEKNASIDGTLANQVSQLSNPNLLINPDFKINQRGTTSISSEQFCTDRWIFSADSTVVTINNNGIMIPVSSGNIFFTQRFEKPLNTSKPVTFTICVNGITHYMRRVYIGENFQYGDVINGATLVARVFSDGSGFTFGVTGENTGNINISYVKLEYGSIPTPFVPPEPATELLKCQRYGEQIYLNAYLPKVYSGLYELNILYSKKRTSAPTITSVDSGNVRFELISSNNCLARASTEAAYVSSIFVDSEIY